MKILDIENTLIFIIDIQEKLLNASFNKETILRNAKIMAKTADVLGIPVVVTEQYPKGLGETISELKQLLPTETSFYEKTSFSALDNLEIVDLINKSNKKQILVMGIETHICVSQTVYALKKLGLDVFVLKDASGSRSQYEYISGLDRIKEFEANIVTTEIALFELLKTAKHPNFKEIQALIK